MVEENILYAASSKKWYDELETAFKDEFLKNYGIFPEGVPIQVTREIGDLISVKPRTSRNIEGVFHSTNINEFEVKGLFFDFGTNTSSKSPFIRIKLGNFRYDISLSRENPSQ